MELSCVVVHSDRSEKIKTIKIIREITISLFGNLSYSVIGEGYYFPNLVMSVSGGLKRNKRNCQFEGVFNKILNVFDGLGCVPLILHRVWQCPKGKSLQL